LRVRQVRRVPKGPRDPSEVRKGSRARQVRSVLRDRKDRREVLVRRDRLGLWVPRVRPEEHKDRRACKGRPVPLDNKALQVRKARPVPVCKVQLVSPVKLARQDPLVQLARQAA